MTNSGTGKFFTELKTSLLSEARHKAKAANDSIVENPWRSIAVAGGLGFVAGLLLGRRR